MPWQILRTTSSNAFRILIKWAKWYPLAWRAILLAWGGAASTNAFRTLNIESNGIV
jgi:hypothetical protein